MRNLFTHAILLIFICISDAAIAFSDVPQFPPTFKPQQACKNCVPTGYSIVTGSPAISNNVGVGGGLQLTWFGSVPKPPSWGGENQAELFLTLENGNAKKDKVKAVVTTIPGVKYTLNYKVLSSRTAISAYGLSGKVEISTTDNFPVLLATKTTSFTAGVNTNIWIYESIVFTATGSQTVVTLSGDSPSNQTGYVNFDIVQNPYDCIIPPDQVVLLRTTLSTPFPCDKINLNDYIKGPIPPGANPVWSLDAVHGIVLPTQTALSAKIDDYFAYYSDSDAGGNNFKACFNVTTSTSKLSIKYVETQVSLKSNSAPINCSQGTKFNLTAQLNQSPYTVRWFSDKTHQGLPLENPAAVGPGTYYAFYYDPIHQCYSTDNAAASATFTVAGPPCCNATGQVLLSNMGYPLQVDCPATSIKVSAFLNYTNVVANNPNLPAGVEIVWYDNASHQGNPVDVSASASIGPGTYYAFFKDVINNCFAVDKSFGVSTRYVKVELAGNCNSGPKLSLRIALQGASELDGEGSIMHANLQSYDTGNGVGLLPTTTPYGGSENCPEINNQASKTERVVDWIKVEVRDAANPSLLLESKSLLLKPDGHVWNVDGVEPVFTPQSNPVRIVVKHRNHLAVMSNPIQSFSSGTVSYDFTTALSQASNAFDDPPQMVLKNGIWCMWAGDVGSQDLGIDAIDNNEIYKVNKQDTSYDIYDSMDINMDGGVDSIDRNLIYLNNITGPISTVANY